MATGTVTQNGELELRVRGQSGFLKEHGHQVGEWPLYLRVVVSGVVDLSVDRVVVFEKEQNMAILLERLQSRQSGIGRKQFQEARPRVAAVGHLGHCLPVVVSQSSALRRIVLLVRPAMGQMRNWSTP